MTELLFIHGILGKPEYFDFLQPYVPDGFQTTAILLEGHNEGPREFARASMARWRSQVSKTVENLRESGNRLVIAAHSMGCLFAIEAAVRGKADALFLLNPPLSLRTSRRLFTTPFKVMRGKIDDRWTRAAKEAYSISDDPNLFLYLGWIPRYLELFGEIHRIRSIVKDLDVPTRVYLSSHDEMVSPRSSRAFPNSPKTIITELPNSGHYYYADSDHDTITRDFSNFLNEIK